MRLLNTLYINQPECYLAADGLTVKVKKNEDVIAVYPLLNLESIVTHGYTGVSPDLIHKCQNNNIAILFMSAHGSFLGRIEGEIKGNVLLRREQFRLADKEEDCCLISRNLILAKTYNQMTLLARMHRDHKMRMEEACLEEAISYLKGSLKNIRTSNDLSMIRGIEGKNAQIYFSKYNYLILQKDSGLEFRGRSRRPPRDSVNAMLSYLYSLLAHHVASALEAVGLDPYVGFLHTDRPGRISLALDMMEELRPILVDRLVLRLINRGEIKAKDFICREDGAVVMTENGRKVILSAWQTKKAEEIIHPFTKEKLVWGLVPYTQALLLSRYIKGELDEYPPFLYRC